MHSKGYVRLQIAGKPASNTSMTPSIRDFATDSSFHVNFRGAGVKTTPGDFIEVDRTFESKALLFSKPDQDRILKQLTLASEVRLRVRMWPYDDLLDTEALPMMGFHDAMQRMMSCVIK